MYITGHSFSHVNIRKALQEESIKAFWLDKSGTRIMLSLTETHPTMFPKLNPALFVYRRTMFSKRRILRDYTTRHKLLAGGSNGGPHV